MLNKMWEYYKLVLNVLSDLIGDVINHSALDEI